MSFVEVRPSFRKCGWKEVAMSVTYGGKKLKLRILFVNWHAKVIHFGG